VGLVRVGLKLTSPAPFGVPFVPITSRATVHVPNSLIKFAILPFSPAQGLSQKIEIQVEGDTSTLKGSSSSSILSYSPRKFPLTSLSSEELSSMVLQEMRSTAEQHVN